MSVTLARLYHLLSGMIRPSPTPIKDAQPIYCKQPPSNQTIADIFEGGWFAAFPQEYGVQAGDHQAFAPSGDDRVAWADGLLPGGVKGRSVLELGPFEAYHTWQLEKLGACPVTSIEANNLNYLKCLLVKEITGLKARFLYGDFVSYLAQCSETFDLVWASGVLYHQAEPVRFVELLSRVTDAVFVHTHYYDQDQIGADRQAASVFVPWRDTVCESRGRRFVLHHRRYGRKGDAHFSGGTETFSYWMERQDILALFQLNGFAHVIDVDDASNPWGPVMRILATKKEPGVRSQGTD